MMRIRFIAVAAGVLVGGCAQKSAVEVDLAMTCQVRECVCEATSSRLFEKPETSDVLWRANGDAYCPPDHALALVPPPPKVGGGIRFN